MIFMTFLICVPMAHGAPSFAIMTKPAPAHFEGSEGFDVVTSRDVGAAHLDEEKAAKQAEAVAVATADADYGLDSD